MPMRQMDGLQPPKQASITFWGVKILYGPQKHSNVVAMYHRQNKGAL